MIRHGENMETLPQTHNPYSWKNFFRLIALTIFTGFVYILLKIQGKLRM